MTRWLSLVPAGRGIFDPKGASIPTLMEDCPLQKMALARMQAKASAHCPLQAYLVP